MDALPTLISFNSAGQPKECRICLLSQNQSDILHKPCKCKGSMSFVHQKCLVRWLTQENKRTCDICMGPFQMQEELGSFSDLIKKNFTYLTGDKKRMLKFGIYILYMYLYGKRFLLVFKYFKNLILKYIFVSEKYWTHLNAKNFNSIPK
jgi:hypothetical protein